MPQFIQWPPISTSKTTSTTVEASDSVHKEDITKPREGFEPFHHHFSIPLNKAAGDESSGRPGAETTLRPVELEINGRKGRRAVCVIYEGGRSFDVFDLDNWDGDDEEEEEEEDGGSADEEGEDYQDDDETEGFEEESMAID